MTNYTHFEEKSLRNHQKKCFFAKVTLKKQKTAGKLATEVRAGDAKIPLFNENLRTIEKIRKSTSRQP